MNYALTSFGYSPRQEAEISKYIGPPLDQTLSALSESDDEVHIDELIAKYRERYFEIGFKENQLYPGVVDMLTALKAENIKMGVCTSKHQTIAIQILQHFEINGFFDFVSGPLDKITKAKQLEELLQQEAISNSSLMIGDRAIDLTSAKQNTLACAGVLWGYGDLEELSAESPNYVFASPMELSNTFIEA